MTHLGDITNIGGYTAPILLLIIILLVASEYSKNNKH